MLSSLSLCSPREWSLACLALSGPFATTGSGKRLLVRQLDVCTVGSPSGEELEGESPRGGDMKPAGVNAPYHFGTILGGKSCFKISVKK